MTNDERLLQIKNTMQMWEDSIVSSSVYEDVMKAFPNKNIEQLIKNTTTNLVDIKKVYDVVTLYEKYKKNAQYLEQHYDTSRVIKLMEMLDEGGILEKCDDIAGVQKEQEELKRKLIGLGFDRFSNTTQNRTKVVDENKKIVSIGIGNEFIAGLKQDGTVVVTGKQVWAFKSVQTWAYVKSIHAGDNYIVGLKRNGTVVAEGLGSWIYDVRTWTQIAAIYARSDCIVGLKRDGTIVWERTGSGLISGPKKPDLWKNLVDVFFVDNTMVGRRRDGTVVIAGAYLRDDYVIDWKNVVSICVSSAGMGRDFYIAGLRQDGIVGVTSSSPYSTYMPYNVRGWTNVKSIYAGSIYIVGLRNDGTVLVTGYDKLQEEIRTWRNIAAVYNFSHPIVGIKQDGTVVSAGFRPYLECEMKKWRDVVSVYGDGYEYVIGLKKDGSVVAASVSLNVDNIKTWTNIASIHIKDRKIVGIKRDGTVVTNTGFDVKDWGT